MGNQAALQTILEAIPGVTKVYYQPPANIEMKYPAIVYNITAINTKYASNMLYKQKIGYQVTIIHNGTNKTIRPYLMEHLLAKWVRSFNKNNLVHEIFELYF